MMPTRTSLDVSRYRASVSQDGFSIVQNIISFAQVELLRTAIAEIPAREEVRRRTNVYGIRNLLSLSRACRDLAASDEVRSLVVPILGEDCFAVRGTFFDKVPGANWNLRWHQDSVIAVKQRIESPGFHAWSTKAGVIQVRPPIEVLQNMLAIRIHLDDSSAVNGALRVLKGSHHQRWERDAMADAKSKFEVVTCEAPMRGALAMRPLLLHASSASESPAHRRVIHIEYATGNLPFGLEWHTRIS